MPARSRTQIPLFLLLCGFTAVNLETAVTSRGTPQPKTYHFRTTPEALTVNWAKLNPLEGFKRVFSRNAAVGTGLGGSISVARPPTGAPIIEMATMPADNGIRPARICSSPGIGRVAWAASTLLPTAKLHHMMAGCIGLPRIATISPPAAGIARNRTQAP